MISQSQEMRMRQRLTRQQVLVSRLLGLSSEDLEQEIKNEIEENPFLEEVIEDTLPASQQESNTDSETAELIDPNDENYPQSIYDYDDYRSARNRSDDSDDGPAIQQADETSFQSMLLEQLQLRPITERERVIGTELIGNIDESGYITRSIGVIADDLAIRRNLDATDEEVEKVLKIIQTFEPAGVGARNLQECLSIQLHRKNDADADTLANAITIVDKYFDDFANKRFEKICRLLNISEEELSEIDDLIRSLNPKPSNGDNNVVQTIIPDFFVYRNGDKLTFSINERNLPKLRKDTAFIERLQEQASRQNASQQRETQRFIDKHTDDAEIFISAVEQRYNTLSLVMGAILKRQQKYFLTGDIADLKPMLQKNIAEDTGLDISVISRVVNQKYAHTEHGVVLLKDLFSNAMAKDDGSDVATRAIKEQLKTIVENEDKSKPLTDEELRQLLQEKGFTMARRTVAKYREALDIPTARLRKEL
ncbi:MAG: RNA polymerase factor sigma-54 [Bacteroidales bacterium]|nr:RNA polymerase factor sigma-54 [Bacteroidales bacterium]